MIAKKTKSIGFMMQDNYSSKGKHLIEPERQLIERWHNLIERWHNKENLVT